MVESQTLAHFNDIAATWEHKGWVHSQTLNSHIDAFIRASEKKIHLHSKQHKTGLYFGIGTGVLFDYLHRYAIAGIDGSAEMLGQCPEGVIQILSQVENLPFLMDEQFNLTFARNLLKHCHEPERAIEQMFLKTKRDGVAVVAESVALHPDDTDIPTQLVRMTDPTHPRFLTHAEITQLFYDAGFANVEIEVMPYRSKWLTKWIQAEQARRNVHQGVLSMYRTAPEDFIRRHDVIIQGDEILSTVPWLLLRAYKS